MANFVYSSTDSNRTAGIHQGGYKSVQAWKTRKTTTNETNSSQIAQTQIIHNLEKAAKGRVGTFDMELETSMAYADAGTKIEATGETSEEAYQFADVIDIINPLQHLPVVSMVYRGLTGDKLHPVSQIIGGALFGGPVGAVTGTINAIAQVQTGSDIGDHVLGFAGIGGSGHSGPAIDKNNPEAQLNQIAKNINQNGTLDDLPGSTLSFVNLAEPHKAYERIKIADGRTAGSMIVKKRMASYRQEPNITSFNNQASIKPPKTDLDNLPKKEDITTIQLSAMPEQASI